MRYSFILLSTVTLFLFPQPALTQSIGDNVGKAVVSKNEVDISLRASRSSLEEGGDVRFGGTIITGKEGANVDDMVDGSTLSVAPDSEVIVDEFVVSSGGRAKIKLVQGVLRFATGSIRGSKVKVETPVAVLAPRGTTFVVSHNDVTGTTVIVEEGSVEFSNLAGDQVIVDSVRTSSIATADTAPTEPEPLNDLAQTALANVNSGLLVFGQSPLGNDAVTQNLSGQVATVNKAAIGTNPTSGAANFGGNDLYAAPLDEERDDNSDEDLSDEDDNDPDDF